MFRYTAKDLIITLACVVSVGGLFAILYKPFTPAVSKAASPPPVITPFEDRPIESQASVHAPDGTKKIMMKVETLPSKEHMYTITTADITGENTHKIYSKTASPDEEILLPANSWSPDNKFVFFLIRTGEHVNAFVFRSDGAPFADGLPYLDLSQIFTKQLNGPIIRDVTGWDDPQLIHVMSYTANHTTGYSYWFDVWNRSFIQLANR